MVTAGQIQTWHGITIKNVLEYIFSETMRCPKMIQIDKGTEVFNG